MLHSTNFYGIDDAIRRMDAVLRHAPGNIYVKDKQGVILYCNQQMCDTLGMSGYEEVVGKMDSNFVATPECADIIRQYDKQAMALATKIECEERAQMLNGDIVTFIGNKKPFYNKGEIIGVWGTSVAASSLPHREDGDYFDSRTNRLLKLTKKQKACLAQLIQGKTAKETAETLHLSIRTVENHIFAIRSSNNIRTLKSLLPHVRVIS